MEENSETDGGSQDEMNTKSKNSTNASVASSSTAGEKGNENESDGSQSHIPEQLDDLRNEGKLRLPSSLNESAESQTVNSRLAKGPNASSSELRHCVRIPSRKKNIFSSPALADPIGNIEGLGPVRGLG